MKKKQSWWGHAYRISCLASVLTIATALSGTSSRACTCDTQGVCDYSGDLLISQVDYPDGRTESKLQLRKHDTGKIYDLKINGSLPSGLQPGMKIRAHGKPSATRKSFSVAADSQGKARLQITDSTTSSVAPTTGLKSLAIIVISSSDFTQSVTDDQLRSSFYTGSQNIAGLYSASSYGAMSFTDGGIYHATLSYATSASCDYSKYSTDALAQIGSVSATYKLYLLPTNSCGWAGLGNLCASGAWIPAAYGLYGDVPAHELGHNVCMHHAAIDPDNNGTNDGEYNDTSCIMGYGGVGWRQFNAAHVDQEGWFPSNRRLLVSSSTTATIAATEVDPTTTALPYVIRMPRGSAGDYYFISYRNRLGNYSSSLPDPGTISIHHAGSSPGYSYLITKLSPGQSWSDSLGGATISFTSSDTTSATVSISYGCTANTPTISIQPATAMTNVQGASKSYLVTVKNNDATGCSASTFTLGDAVPAGFSGGFDSGTVNVSAGGSASTNFTLTSSAGLADASYSFSLNASDASHSAVSVNGGFVQDTTAPSAPSNLSASAARKGKTKGVTITWTDGTDNLSGIAGSNVYKNGTKLNSALTSSGFRDGSGTSGTVYEVTDVDGAGNESLRSSVTAR